MKPSVNHRTNLSKSSVVVVQVHALALRCKATMLFAWPFRYSYLSNIRWRSTRADFLLRLLYTLPHFAQLELEERTSVARARPHRERNENGEAGGGGEGRGRGRGRRGGGGGGTGENGEHAAENGEEGGEGRGRRVPPVAENSVYIKGFPDTTTEEEIRAEVG